MSEETMFNWKAEGFSSYAESVSRICSCGHKLSEHLGGYDEDESCAHRDCDCPRFIESVLDAATAAA